ncbi:hypothetical protein DOT_6182 [Desulfosporosinus sp. OT]|nr:hypothetical protein DOT_6182 [Desulfosporosinus sp. OT]
MIASSFMTPARSLASTVGAKNPYVYREYRYDSETGLYYLQSRYYSPDGSRLLMPMLYVEK